MRASLAHCRARHHHATIRLPILRAPARSLGRDRRPEDRLQRPLPDVLRHGRGRLLARPGAALRGDDAGARRRSVRAQGRRSNTWPRPATTTCSTSACAAPASATRRSPSPAPSSARTSCWSSCALIYVFADAEGTASQPVPPALRAAASIASRPASRCSTSASAPGASSGEPARADPHRGLHRRAEDPGRDGMGRCRRGRRPRRRLQPARPRPRRPGACSSTFPAWPRSAGWRWSAGSRHSGVGRAVLDALLDAARARGDREAVLHAQTQRGAVLRARRVRAPRARCSTRPASPTSRCCARSEPWALRRQARRPSRRPRRWRAPSMKASARPRASRSHARSRVDRRVARWRRA